MRRLARLTLAALLILAMFAAGWVVAMTRMGAAVDPASLTELERLFTERMNGATMIGQFTVTGREGKTDRRPDRYDIASVEKVGDDQWRFNARMRYANVDVTVPVVVTTRWVGDTPMITMTDVSIPTLGTFTVRVFFYGDRYAGTWQHNRVGGHMFGSIEKTSNGPP